MGFTYPPNKNGKFCTFLGQIEPKELDFSFLAFKFKVPPPKLISFPLHSFRNRMYFRDQSIYNHFTLNGNFFDNHETSFCISGQVTERIVKMTGSESIVIPPTIQKARINEKMTFLLLLAILAIIEKAKYQY